MVDFSHYETIRVEREDDILILTLNRPERLNAVNGQMHTELAHIFLDVDRDQEANVVVITGAGRGFCAGGDVSGMTSETGSNLIPQGAAFTIGDVLITWKLVTALLIIVPALIVLSWFVTATRQGKAMRAVSQDTEASAMMGINVNRTISITFFIAGALAAVAGLVFLLEYNIRYDTGFELGLIAFTAAVLGGIGNLAGAVLGALVIGFVQSFNEGLTWFAPGGDWTRSIVFGILIAVLVFRPEGILGERTPVAALLHSSNGRGTALFGTPDHDAAELERRFPGLPHAGMVTAGEFGPVGRKSYRFAFSASIGLLTYSAPSADAIDAMPA